MRIIVVDNDKTFTTSLSQRCQKASVFCQVIGAAATAFAEIKKNPDQVDIVLIAKELGAGQDGLQVAQMLRKDPKTADVPYVLMSSTWGKPEFAKHQKTEFGANAYYSKKSSMTELESTIEAVTGFKFTAAPAAKSGSTGNTGLLNIKLEAASDVVNIAEDVPNDISMSEPIALFDEASPPAPAAPKAAAPPPPSKAPAPAAAAPAVEAPNISIDAGGGGGGIEISLGGGEAPKVESKPVATPAHTSTADASGISVDFGGDFQLEGSNSKVLDQPAPQAPPPAAAPTYDAGMASLVIPAGQGPAHTAPAPAAGAASLSIPAAGADPALAQTDNALFSIDLNAGNEAPVEAPAAPKAKPAAAAAPAPSIPEPSVTVEPAVEAPAISVGAPAEINLGEIAVAPPEAAVAPSVSADATESADAPSSLDIGGATVVPADASGGLSIEAAAPPPPPEPSAPVIAAAPAPIPEPSAPPVSEEEAAKDLPYLFAGPSAALSAGASAHAAPAINFGQQPAAHQRADMSSSGGANEDVETLKKYLTMREQDVSVLTAQLTYAKEELGKSEDTIKRLTLQGEDLFHQINDLQQKSEKLEQELQHAGKSREGELEQLRFEVKSKIDRIKFLEDRLTDSATQYEKLKERVRLDIRKIRIREKELESKLEILKKDSETLIGARENKILELKRKIDLLEFNYDTLQDKNDVEKQNVVKANEKIDRVLKVLKLAVGVIEAEGEQGSDGAQAHGSGAGTGASKVA